MEEPGMSKLRLAMACWNYDRTRALLEDRIPIDGIDLTYINIPVEETFFRMIRHREFDVAEMSLSSYTLSMFRDPSRLSPFPFFLHVTSGTPASTLTATAASGSQRTWPESALATRNINLRRACGSAGS